MASTIGSVACDYLAEAARPPALEQGVETWIRPGVDGVASRTTGLRGGPFVLQARKVAAAATVDAWLASLSALAGAAAVTVTFDSGAAYTDCYIGRAEGRAVEVTRYQPGVSAGSAVVIAEVNVHGWRS